MIKKISLLTLAVTFTLSGNLFAQKKKSKKAASQNTSSSYFNSELLSGLKFREIGPATASGRIADLAVNPDNHSEYYVAVASGGVWKTVNAGTTYEPVFDDQGSYSVGCVTIDPANPNTVWVGTGENNNQRSVAYGDGVYRSDDGGKTWKNTGLKNSEHIGMIKVHPDNSNIVYVAAYGPLWNEGGDRGLYKTEDGGKTWNRILYVSEHTGINEIHLDPRDPNIMYAAAHQRRRRVFTHLGGGPESAIYKSTDGGKNWKKIDTGLPKDIDLGRIGLAVSPADPDVIYAVIEAEGEKGGFFRSRNRGESWEKMNDYFTSGNYYQEIFCDPKDVNTVYFADTWAHVTFDGGKNINQLGEKNKHVDNHVYWIDPTDTNHILAGCDGGIYETYDRAKTWQFKPNLPITQFYKVATDNAEPFYNIYGGTQDNNTLGGPSRTNQAVGIVNSHWIVTKGGDGFEPQVDPTDPNIIYSQSQYGWLARYDKSTGEETGIKPIEGKGEPGLRWNWDAPLIISPHNHKRLYFAANKLFRSDDRGDSWTAITDDLTRKIDRNQLTVMGKVWSADAVAKNKSTSIYGNIVSLAESPLKEGLLYAGTDDGLIHVIDDNGNAVRKIEKVAGVPEMTYVNHLTASLHDQNTVYAAFNNHKNGDFKPYLFKSTDAGQSWTSINGNLPKKGSTYVIAEDHVNPSLLFAGTEFGVFFTLDGGNDWQQLKSGLPTVAVRDIDIQRRENDLVLATFGRGFYVLDDYSSLRELNKTIFDQEAHIFAVKEAPMYFEASEYGNVETNKGESYYRAENPDVGAVFTYYLKENIKTLKEKRQEEEKVMTEKGQKIRYPDADEFRAEDNEEEPFLLFTVTDSKGNIVRKLKTEPKKGIQRITWDFRYPSTAPTKLKKDEYNRYGSTDAGRTALPGTYLVSLSKSVNGKITDLAGPVKFKIYPLNKTTVSADDHLALEAFHEAVDELKRIAYGASQAAEESGEKINYLKKSLENTTANTVEIRNRLKAVENSLIQLKIKLDGDVSLSKREFEVPMSITDRISIIIDNSTLSFAPLRPADKASYAIAKEELTPILESLKASKSELNTIEIELEQLKAPLTPGRMPTLRD